MEHVVEVVCMAVGMPALVARVVVKVPVRARAMDLVSVVAITLVKTLVINAVCRLFLMFAECRK